MRRIAKSLDASRFEAELIWFLNGQSPFNVVAIDYSDVVLNEAASLTTQALMDRKAGSYKLLQLRKSSGAFWVASNWSGELLEQARNSWFFPADRFGFVYGVAFGSKDHPDHTVSEAWQKLREARLLQSSYTIAAFFCGVVAAKRFQRTEWNARYLKLIGH